MIEYLKNFEISDIIGLSALILSILNLVYIIKNNKKNVKIELNYYTSIKLNNKNFYMLNVDIINSSSLPISITEVILNDEKIIKTPRKLAYIENKSGGKVVSSSSIYSATFPINLAGYCSEQKFFVMYGKNENFSGNKLNMTIKTNRGIVKHKFVIEEKFLNKNEFVNETNNYQE